MKIAAEAAEALRAKQTVGHLAVDEGEAAPDHRDLIQQLHRPPAGGGGGGQAHYKGKEREREGGNRLTVKLNRSSNLKE